MTRATSFLLAALLLPQLASASDITMNRDNGTDKAIVFFYGFEVERVTGIPENEIERYGCRYLINRDAFLAALAPNSSKSHYQPLDVRGEVIFSTDRIYYIDHEGVVRLGNKYYLVDKKSFNTEISPVGKC